MVSTVPVEKGESRAGATEKSRHILYERKVARVSLVERIEVDNIEFADIHHPVGTLRAVA
jgi:hypothetical protein